MKRVVVTGLGVVSPVGNDTDAFWEALSAGVSGAGPITRFDASDHATRYAAEVKDFDPKPYFTSPKTFRRGLQTAPQALPSPKFEPMGRAAS